MEADRKITVKDHTALFTGNDMKFGNEQMSQSCSSDRYDESMADRNTYSTNTLVRANELESFLYLEWGGRMVVLGVWEDEMYMRYV